LTGAIQVTISRAMVEHVMTKSAVPVVEAIEKHANSRPESAAIIIGDTTVSYGSLFENCLGVAAHFKDRGLVAGDRVLLKAERSLPFIVSYFATHLAGGITIPLSPDVPPARLEEILATVEPKLQFWSDAPDITAALHRSWDAASRAAPEKIDLLSASDLLMTSGTTGKPKFVLLRHLNTATAAKNINSMLGNGPGDTEVLALPLSHSFGLGRLRCVLLAGGTAVLVDGFARPGRYFKAIKEHEATGLSFVPAAWSMLYKLTGSHLAKFADQIKYIEIGSSDMKLSEKTALSDLLPDTRLLMHYGQTEASRSSFLDFARDREALESIGFPAPDVSISIQDEMGRICEAGREGEICIKANTVFAQYWRDEKLTQESFRGEWFKSGDMGRFDAEGRLWLVGRKKEMINVGGRKVAPLEIETALNSCPGIADSACLGVTDELSGESIRAFLVATDAPVKEEDIVRHLRERLEPYKCPNKFTWVESIPRNPSGKMMRNRLLDSNHE
jgi:long-chain acyl-CoA synthetase